VSDFSGLWLERSYMLEVAPSGSVQIQPAGLPAAKVGVAFDQQFSCSGAQGPCQFGVASGTLPPGLELTAQGRLHGTPAQMGAARFTIEARDQGGAQARREYELESEGVAVMPAAWKPAETGVAVNELLSVDPQLAGVQFRIAGGSLPSGVTLGVDGALGGRATASGVSTVVVEAVWKGFRAGSRLYQLQVIEPLRLVADKLRRVQIGAFYRAALEARGGHPPYSYSASGQLPAGLRLEAAGWISGIAETAGDFTINVTVTDSAGLTNSGAVAVKVENVGVKITTTWLPDGKADADYSATIMATGGTPPYRWSILEGYLPNSFALSSDGVLRGRIPYPVAINLTAIVVDAEGREARQLLTLNIKPAEPQNGLFTVQPAELGFQADEGSREEMSRCLSVYATGQPASVRAAVVSEAGSAWLTLSGAEAQTPGLICAIVKPGGTAAGQWNKTIELTVTGATPAKVLVPVLLRILPRPQAALAVLPTAVKLSAPAGAGTVSTTLRLANEGTAEASVSASADNAGWLTAPAGPWTVQPSESRSVEIQADATGLSPGLYSSAVVFNSGGISAKASIDLPVGAAGKMLEIDRKSITFATWPGSDNPTPQDLLVRNTGTAGVAFSIASAGQDLPSWLILPETGCGSASRVLNPGESCALNLHVNAQGLDAGVRQAVLRIAGAALPLDVLVTLIVGGEDSSGATASGSGALLFVHGLDDSAKGQDVVLPGPPSRKGKVSWAVSAGERVDWLKVSPTELEASLSGTVQFSLGVDWTAGLKEGVNRAVLRLSFADGGSQSIHVVALAIPEAKLQSLQSGPAAASCGDRLFAVVLDPAPEFRATMPNSLPVMAAFFDCAGQPAGGLDVFAALGGTSQRLSGDGKGRYSSSLPLGEASDAAVLTISGWRPGGAATASDEVSGKVRQAEDGGPVVSQVLNGMGYEGPVVPDSWITIRGRGFAARPAEDPDLPESLSGVSASVGGVSLKLRGAGADNIVAYVAHSLPTGGRASLTVSSGGRMSAPFEVVLTTHAPLLYAQGGSAVALGWCEATVAGISAASPVPSGCVLHLYASGIGNGIAPIVLAGPAEISPESVSNLEGHPGFQEVVFKLPDDTGGAPEIAIQLKQGALVSNKVLVPLKAN
jgi:hypothetical protein